MRATVHVPVRKNASKNEGTSSEPQRRRRGTGRALVWAAWPAISERVVGKWPLAAIFDDLGEALQGISYSQFTRYVRRYTEETGLLSSSTAAAQSKHPAALPTPLAEGGPPARGTALPKFHYNADTAKLADKLI